MDAANAALKNKQDKEMNQKYTDMNSRIIDQWVSDGWEWGKPIDHETFLNKVMFYYNGYLSKKK